MNTFFKASNCTFDRNQALQRNVHLRQPMKRVSATFTLFYLVNGSLGPLFGNSMGLCLIKSGKQRYCMK